MTTDSQTPRRFKVALSFPGDHRGRVEPIAELLREKFGESCVLYDKYHDAEFARLDLDVYLPGLYRNDSELIVIVLCPEYAQKRWCRLEWRHIRQIISTADAERIMFLSIGDPGDLSELGILDGDGYIDIHPLSPEVVAEKVLTRLALNTVTQPPEPDDTSPAIPVDVSRVIRYAPDQLLGREAELAVLDDAWQQVRDHATGRAHVLTFVALGGEGKTSLAAKWVASLADRDWPECQAVFAWSFYSQGTREQVAASSDLFLREALLFFGDRQTADSTVGAFEKGRRLAQLVGEQRALLVLDGLEPLQYAPTSPTPGKLKDQGVEALLLGLAASSSGLCLVTTRYSIPNLNAFRQTTAPEVELTRLSREAGVELLQSCGVTGSEQRTVPSDDGSEMLNEFEKLVEDVQGHALTLHIMGDFLKRAHRGDIRRRDRVAFETADQKIQGGHAFRAMAAYEAWLQDDSDEARRELAILRLMGLFDRPASADCIEALLQPPAIDGLTEPLVDLDESDWDFSLDALESANLLTVHRDSAGTLQSLDAHPLLREYFATALRRPDQAERRSGSPAEPVAPAELDVDGGDDAGTAQSLVRPTDNPAFTAAHSRLFDHLCETTEHRPDTLDGLQPLYQAVTHGCLAGRQQEACDKVFFDRIRRGDEAFSQRKLGAIGADLGAVASFFELPWQRLSPNLSEADQAWLLNEAAFRLRALGRLAEAREPMRIAIDMAVTAENWMSAASRASNLSELDVTLGRLDDAVAHGRLAVDSADRSGEARHEMSKRCSLADAEHQRGDRVAARTLLEDAERRQAEWQPQFPLLYSTLGFRYADLILAPAERAAWQVLLRGTGFQPVMSDDEHGLEARATALAACTEAARRATQTLAWALSVPNASLLDIALDYLTLGRAALYRAILEAAGDAHTKAQRHEETPATAPLCAFVSSCEALTEAASQLTQALDGLRKASALNHLPKALLTSAWLAGVSESAGWETAAVDLAEAEEIARRGPMPLYLADVHLTRARLAHVFPDRWPGCDPRTELNAARELIEKHNYGRRTEELADAQAAIDAGKQ